MKVPATLDVVFTHAITMEVQPFQQLETSFFWSVPASAFALKEAFFLFPPKMSQRENNGKASPCSTAQGLTVQVSKLSHAVRREKRQRERRKQTSNANKAIKFVPSNSPALAPPSFPPATVKYIHRYHSTCIFRFFSFDYTGGVNINIWRL